MQPTINTRRAETVARMADCMRDLEHCGADRETLKLKGGFSEAELDECEREAAAQANARATRRIA